MQNTHSCQAIGWWHWMTIPKIWPKPIPRLFFRYQIFRNRYRDLFSDTKFSETETLKKLAKVSKPKCQSLPVAPLRLPPFFPKFCCRPTQAMHKGPIFPGSSSSCRPTTTRSARSPPSSGGRYPCFLIEWIFHWIESSQIRFLSQFLNWILACFFGRVNLLGEGILVRSVARRLEMAELWPRVWFKILHFLIPGAFSNNHLRMTLVAKQKASNLQVMFPYRVSQSAMPASSIPVA